MNQEYDENTEEQITEMIAHAFYFRKVESGKSYSCTLCDKNFSLFYYGSPINERMIKHYETYHAIY